MWNKFIFFWICSLQEGSTLWFLVENITAVKSLAQQTLIYSFRYLSHLFISIVGIPLVRRVWNSAACLRFGWPQGEEAEYLNPFSFAPGGTGQIENLMAQKGGCYSLGLVLSWEEWKSEVGIRRPSSSSDLLLCHKSPAPLSVQGLSETWQQSSSSSLSQGFM